MRDEFIKTLTELASQNPDIMLITGDLGFGVLDKFAEELPEQFINAGVAEQNMTGLATGLALEGKVVFTYSIANFSTLRCLEQIRNDACYHGANVKVVSIGAGFSYGSLGYSHHATEDLAIMSALPEITIFSPACLWETRQATQAIVKLPGASYLRLDKSHAGETNKPGEVFQVGQIRLLKNGSDISLFATGGILNEVLKAADLLSQDGISCRVYSVPTIIPLDTATVLTAAKETGGIVSIEEHIVHGGLGGMIAETCLEHNQSPKVFYRLGIRGGFCSIVGSQDYLRKKCELDCISIVSHVKRLLLKKH